MPTVMVIVSSPVSKAIDRATASRRRRASAAHWPASSIPSAIIRNSSPPQRATVSPGRTAAINRWPTATSARSPAAWPRRSLSDLKLSRSPKSTPTEPGPRLARPRARERCSTASGRLGSDVSSSCDARHASCAWASWRAMARWAARLSRSVVTSCLAIQSCAPSSIALTAAAVVSWPLRTTSGRLGDVLRSAMTASSPAASGRPRSMNAQA